MATNIDATKKALEQIAGAVGSEKPKPTISARSFFAGDPKFQKSEMRVSPGSFSEQGSVKDQRRSVTPAGGILAGSKINALAGDNSLTNRWDARGRLTGPGKPAAAGIASAASGAVGAADGVLEVRPLLTADDRELRSGFGRMSVFGAGDPLLMRSGATAAAALPAAPGDIEPQVPDAWRDRARPRLTLGDPLANIGEGFGDGL